MDERTHADHAAVHAHPTSTGTCGRPSSCSSRSSSSPASPWRRGPSTSDPPGHRPRPPHRLGEGLARGRLVHAPRLREALVYWVLALTPCSSCPFSSSGASRPRAPCTADHVLRAFHVVFIAASTLLAFFYATWCLVLADREDSAGARRAPPRLRPGSASSPTRRGSSGRRHHGRVGRLGGRAGHR